MYIKYIRWLSLKCPSEVYLANNQCGGGALCVCLYGVCLSECVSLRDDCLCENLGKEKTMAIKLADMLLEKSKYKKLQLKSLFWTFFKSFKRNRFLLFFFLLHYQQFLFYYILPVSFIKNVIFYGIPCTLKYMFICQLF